MKNSAYSNILGDFSNRIHLFENPEEMDAFLSEAISLLMKESGAAIGAVLVYNEEEDELVFRVGYDEGDFWNQLRCDKGHVPLRLSVEGNEAGKAFNEGRVRLLSYDEVDERYPFRSKILIPIVRGPEKMGIFMMAHEESGAFNDIDQLDILKAAAKLGDMLAEATVLVNHEAERSSDKILQDEKIITGLKTSEGFVEGKALPIWSDIDSVIANLPPQGDLDAELKLFQTALSLSFEQLDEIQRADRLDHEMISLIFTAQYYMLKDTTFTGKMEELIKEGKPAYKAVQSVINEYANRFARMSEIRLAEKAQDVRDLGFRLITNMANKQRSEFSYKGRIVLSRHIYPSDLFRLAVENVAGLVLRGAGVTAHISILARSLELPVLITNDKALLSIPENADLMLDASGGKLYVNPTEVNRISLRSQRIVKVEERNFYLLRGATADNVGVQVLANVNLYNDAKQALSQGAEGIGLYRTEFPFILKKDFLSEEQQYRIYKTIVDTQQGKPIVMRTTDIGGDKLLQGRSTAESNPFLGVRGIRFSLANREMFRDQLRAMLRAGYNEDLGILLPMVTDVEEVLMVKEELEICKTQLEKRGARYNKAPKLGAMVELPSAALSVDELAAETDFLSIGSNDLTMYLLAVDRTNENLSHLYRSHHPAVLKVFAKIAKDAGPMISELSICGDVASDPILIPFFIGLGIRKLSVTPAKIEEVKQIVNSYTLQEAEAISKIILSIKRVREMEEYISTL